MTWVFNDAETNSLVKLNPYNSGMSGLASVGNVLATHVGAIQTKVTTFNPPGADWVSQRTAGRREREVRWNWRISATSEGTLYSVEAKIDAYLDDGREYILSDGTRTSSYAVLAPQTGPQGRPRATVGGRWIRDWVLVFRILRPLVGATKL